MKKILLPLFLGLAMNTASAQSSTVTIRSSPSNSSYRYVISDPAVMYSSYGGPSMIIADWTSSGVPYVWRSLLKFNLPTLPAGSIIDSASLSLYANPTSPSGNPGSPTWGTDNAVGIYRFTAAWDTATLTWPSQPATTAVHGDTLPQSTSWVEDYLDVDVTGLIKDSYTSGNYGFLFRHLQETTPLNSMIFYSPYEYAADSNKSPKLVIHYRNPLAVGAVNEQQATLDIYPNPAHGKVNIGVKATSVDGLAVCISDVLGRTVFTKQIDGNGSLQNIAVNVSDYVKGCYMITLRNGSGVLQSQKLVIE